MIIIKNQTSIHFLTEEHDKEIIIELVTRMTKLQTCDLIIPQIENKKTVIQNTGDILLVSLSFITKIEFLNSLSSQYTYINFIHPRALSQFDESKLLMQVIALSKSVSLNEISKTSRNGWRFFDYYQELK
ncbi:MULTISPECIES: hypothetical protein [Enterococcus]|uniref:Uncharacterized protein n=1 Tax=Enterococcus sulfureus ATCC 49903 TaxID=1140003 RepID=S0KUY4_9ENTE|nr:hypothetical protein [Enterococcus sulfureus]EOT48634.1 hypothetical protein OMY_00589 [Enterococcus sulfureus ATCC 49903]EOT87526.1 hypothetical protein I573_00582 [Enterococcus sulfureus ATCC 49903]